MTRLEIKKLQYDLKKQAAEILALSSIWIDQIDQYECLAGDEMLPPD